MMRKGFFQSVTVGLFISTLFAPGVRAQSVLPTDEMTQARAVSQLMAVFHDVPSWPKYLEAIDPQTQSYNWTHVDDALPSSKWTGLSCVFPGRKTTQYAALLGIQESDPNAHVTALQLAQWIVDWEVKARRVDLAQEPIKNPFALLKLFSFFWGTKIASPNSVITASDMVAIRDNIVAVSRGWRMLSPSTVQFLEPLADCVNIKIQFPALVANHEFTKANWPEVYGDITKLQDSMTLTVASNGDVIYRYQKGTGYSLGIGGHFVNQQGVVYSSYSWKIAHLFRENSFDEPSPEVFDPRVHTSDFPFAGKGELGMALPAEVGYIFYFDGMAINPFSAKLGLAVAPDLGFSIGYDEGKIDWIRQIGPASLNYPSEVDAYGS